MGRQRNSRSGGGLGRLGGVVALRGIRVIVEIAPVAGLDHMEAQAGIAATDPG